MSLRALLLWCCATAMSWSATVPVPIAGPWTVLHGDGSVRVVVELGGGTEPGTAELLQLRRVDTGRNRPVVVALDPEVRVIERPYSPPSRLVIFTLSAQQALHAELDCWFGPGVTARVTIPRRPTRRALARLAVVGGRQWPDAATMTALGERLGGPPQAALVLGADWAQALGTGGWESQVPLIVPSRGDGGVEVLDDLVGPAHDWQQGLSWGVLGLPLVDDPAVAAVPMAQDLSPWQVPIDLGAHWRLDRSAPSEANRLAAIAMLVDAASRRGAPLILAGGSPVGFISDPLVTEDDLTVSAAGGGVRYVAATPTATAAVVLPFAVAQALDEPRLMGLVADADELRLVSVGGDGRDLDLLWDRPAESSITNGWGNGSGEALFGRWKGVDDDNPADGSELARLSWLPMPELRELAVSSETLRTLRADDGSPARNLLHRLTASDAILINEWVASEGALGASLRRDLVLRSLAQPKRWRENGFQTLVESITDGEVVRSLLAVADRQRSMVLLHAMRDRLQRQAAGDFPIDTDPLLQHALTSALFDSPYLSPTPLRPLARALEGKLSELAWNPVQRFLDRYGAHRPVD